MACYQWLHVLITIIWVIISMPKFCEEFNYFFIHHNLFKFVWHDWRPLQLKSDGYSFGVWWNVLPLTVLQNKFTKHWSIKLSYKRLFWSVVLTVQCWVLSVMKMMFFFFLSGSSAALLLSDLSLLLSPLSEQQIYTSGLSLVVSRRFTTTPSRQRPWQTPLPVYYFKIKQRLVKSPCK